eukprot:527375-Pyramimonas_sp.AAC.1
MVKLFSLSIGVTDSRQGPIQAQAAVDTSRRRLYLHGHVADAPARNGTATLLRNTTRPRRTAAGCT